MWYCEYKGHDIDFQVIRDNEYYVVDRTEPDCFWFETLEEAKSWIDDGCPVWEGEEE